MWELIWPKSQFKYSLIYVPILRINNVVENYGNFRVAIDNSKMTSWNDSTAREEILNDASLQIPKSYKMTVFFVRKFSHGLSLFTLWPFNRERSSLNHIHYLCFSWRGHEKKEKSVLSESAEVGLQTERISWWQPQPLCDTLRPWKSRHVYLAPRIGYLLFICCCLLMVQFMLILSTLG